MHYTESRHPEQRSLFSRFLWAYVKLAYLLMGGYLISFAYERYGLVERTNLAQERLTRPKGMEDVAMGLAESVSLASAPRETLEKLVYLKEDTLKMLLFTAAAPLGFPMVAMAGGIAGVRHPFLVGPSPGWAQSVYQGVNSQPVKETMTAGRL